MTTNPWLVYIVETHNGLLYTGITNNMERRFAQHQAKNKGAQFFHISSAKKIVYREFQPNRSEATKRELAIKKMSKAQKLQLISQAPDFI